MQQEGAVRQSSKVVSWPNSVLVAPTRLARQNCALAPSQAKCSPFWAVGKHGAAERVCRTNKDGATILLCRANGNGATKGICHATMSKMQSFLDFDTPWRGSVALSRQQHWRDQPTLSHRWEWVRARFAAFSGLGQSLARHGCSVAPPVTSQFSSQLRGSVEIYNANS